MREKGVSNDYERKRLEYSPLLKYINEFVYSEGMADAEYEISPEIEEFSMHSPSNTIKELELAQSSLDKSIEVIEERLKDDVAKVKDSEGVAKTITFKEFKQAVKRADTENSSEIINSYEEYHSEIEGKYEALLYRSLINARKEVLSEKSSIQDVFSGLIVSPFTKSTSISVVDKERDFVRAWAKLEKREQELSERLEELDPIADISSNERVQAEYREVKREYEKVSKDKRFFDINPLAAVSKSYYDRSKESKTLGDKTYNLLMHTVSDSFHGILGHIIKKIVRLDKGSFDAKEFRALIEDSIQVCQSIQQGIRFIALGLSMDSLSMTNILESTISSIISGIIPHIMDIFSTLKMDVTIPIYNWLEELAEDEPDADLLPMTKLATVLMDALDEIDHQFRSTLMDFHKIGMSKRRDGDRMLDAIEQRKWMSDLYKVLDQIIRELRSIRNIDNVEEFVLDRWVVNIIADNKWDVRFNMNTGKYEKVNTLIKPY